MYIFPRRMPRRSSIPTKSSALNLQGGDLDTQLGRVLNDHFQFMNMDGITQAPSCMSCYNGQPKDNCNNIVVWKRDSNQPSNEGNCMLICCWVARSLNRGNTVNGNKYDKTSGITS